MKNEFVQPSIHIDQFSVETVITTSGFAPDTSGDHAFGERT